MTPTRKPLPVGAARCRAKSKQSQEQCKRHVTPGKTLCYYHGSKSEGVPNVQGSTHMQRTEFVRKDQLPQIVDRMRQLDSKEGKAEAVKLRFALTEHLADTLAPTPERPELVELALKAEDRLTKNLSLLHEMEAEQVSQAPTTFIIGAFDASAAPVTPFQARTIDGPCTIRYLDGEPFMLEGRCWVPAIKQVDDESGAEYYTRLLEA